MNTIGYVWMHHGLGTHLSEVPYGDILYGLKLLFAGEVLQTVAITFIRTSTALMYDRLFGVPGSAFRRWTWLTIAVNISWLLAFGAMAIFQCKPIRAFWDKEVTDAKCIPVLTNQLAAGISSVLLDLWLLLLPLPMLWRLDMKWKRKLLLLGLFFVGYS